MIDYIRANHLYGVEDKWVRAAWIHSRCLFISVQQALHVSNCLPLTLFISLKFVQDCHQLSEFQEVFLFLFLEKSILICYRYLLNGIYISNCTWVLSVMIRHFHFYHYFNYTCSIYTNLLVIFWSACSDEFYFCFACFKISHWMSFLSLVLIHVWHVTKGCFFLLLL